MERKLGPGTKIGWKLTDLEPLFGDTGETPRLLFARPQARRSQPEVTGVSPDRKPLLHPLHPIGQQFVHRRSKILRRNRLSEMNLETGRTATFHVLLRPVPAQGNTGQVATVVLQFPKEIVSAAIRKSDIAH